MGRGLFTRHGNWRGFTLPEVLVSITIVGLLAAVVIPTVAGAVRKGDSGKAGDDLAAIRAASEQFLADVRKYPNSIGQLTSPIKTSMTPLAGTSASSYGVADSARWRGPYLTKDSLATVMTGFGLKMNGTFETDSLLPSGFDNVSTPGFQKYMAIQVPGVDSSSWSLIDQAFDDGVALTGTIRFKTNAMKFLALPIH